MNLLYIKNKFKDNDNVFLLLIITIWVSLLVGSGSIFSGFHFTDNHEFLGIYKQIKTEGLFETISYQLHFDYFDFHRFRPFYFLNEIMMVYFFGVNFCSISIYYICLSITVSILLFYFFKNIGMSNIISFFGTMIVLLGEQAAIWWRLGPNETIATTMLISSLFFMSLYLRKRKRIFDILSYVFLILATLSKENYLLLIPAIIILRVYLEYKFYKPDLKKLITNNLLFAIFFGILALIELYFITRTSISFNDVGIVNIKYMKIISTFISVLKVNFYGIIILILLVFNIKKVKDNLLEFCVYFLVFFLIIFPQIYIFSNALYNERYLLPGVLGFGILIVFLLSKIDLNEFNISEKLKGLFFFLFITGIIGFIIYVLLLINQNTNDVLLNIVSIIKRKQGDASWIWKLKDFVFKSSLFLTFTGISIIFYNFFHKRNLIKNNFSSFLLPFILLGIISCFFYDSMKYDKNFTIEGKWTNIALKDITSKTNHDTNILIVNDSINNYENGYSIKSYLNNISDRNNLYLYSMISSSTVSKGFITDNVKKDSEFNYGKRWYLANRFENVSDKNIFNCIIIMSYFYNLNPALENDFKRINTSWFNENNFIRKDFYFITVFYKKL